MLLLLVFRTVVAALLLLLIAIVGGSSASPGVTLASPGVTIVSPRDYFASPRDYLVPLAWLAFLPMSVSAPTAVSASVAFLILNTLLDSSGVDYAGIPICPEALSTLSDGNAIPLFPMIMSHICGNNSPCRGLVK